MKGFTLIELMILIAIVGIIAAIFIPAIQETMEIPNEEEKETNIERTW